MVPPLNGEKDELLNGALFMDHVRLAALSIKAIACTSCFVFSVISVLFHTSYSICGRLPLFLSDYSFTILGQNPWHSSHVGVSLPSV